MMAKPNETAVLIVNGREFAEWETVSVRRTLRDTPPFHCRFTCSEGMPISKNFAKLQIMPGDDCTVILAGHLAFTGKVETRQVYYDAQRHQIELQCATFVDLATGSVIHKTGEWIDKTFAQIAQDVLGKLGIRLVFEGGPPPAYRFPRVSVTPGESIYDFLDMLSRGLSEGSGVGLSFTTNDAGDFVVAMGPFAKIDRVTEGRDILIGREIIYNPSMAGIAPAIVQGPGDDAKWGAGVASVPYFAHRTTEMVLPGTAAPSVIRAEMASSDRTLLKGRTVNESQWLAADQITVIATVHGWLAPSGGLWRHNQQVVVTSPMLMMNGDTLRLKATTFTQDNTTGTRTVLEMCNEAAIGGSKPPIR